MKAKTWSALFNRQGFEVAEVKNGVFDCKSESAENIEFLLESLDNGKIAYRYHSFILSIESAPITEGEWLKLVDFENRGHAGFYFRADCEIPRVFELDTHISGIVRQLNRLGLYTNGSCDGHGTRHALVMIKRDEDVETSKNVLLAAGINRIVTRGRNMRLLITERAQLLDVAEKLQLIEKGWLKEGSSYIREQFFYHSLEELLSIDGESGNEEGVRSYVLDQLRDVVDHVTVDQYGNILAQKTYRNGNGPTMLLNAHLDTVESFIPGRVLQKDGAIWSSSEGILGADDRAGVAVVLEMAKRLDASDFRGKVKFIFTVKEEVGLVGARAVNEYFLWDVDAAIVVDRRGAGDIVTSCGGQIPFCHEAYGEFIEGVAMSQGLQGWKTTSGGSSDTRIWAEHGIHSVYLSAGYQNEHTDMETLDVTASYRTLNLLEGVFAQGRELQRIVNRLRRLNRRARAI
ncbi:M20/M25/M40 family metallo-hydrolase [Desertibacillus haloalkaliphilus]|nr:M20/M25/M40 family metallo-hydrolase [Desertibacillus haloalkaliphilus]